MQGSQYVECLPSLQVGVWVEGVVSEGVGCGGVGVLVDLACWRVSLR